MKKYAGEQIRVIMTLTGDDARRLREFMEREGLESPHAAMRALALSALDITPAIGLGREARLRITTEVRTALLSHLHASFRAFIAEATAEIEGDRNVEATIEKEQVTFSRENQE